MSREQCLENIRRRMERNNIFFPDIWNKLLDTETKVLKEIVESEFEREIFERIRPSRHL